LGYRVKSPTTLSLTIQKENKMVFFEFIAVMAVYGSLGALGGAMAWKD
jgi:hypothetical protein